MGVRVHGHREVFPIGGGMIGGMTLVKTSVTLPRADLEEARRRGVNVSALARQALRDHLNELTDEAQVNGYAAAFAEDDVTEWDATTGDGIEPDEYYDGEDAGNR
jgi:post-segregation antitoxin (ccd killing protein)